MRIIFSLFAVCFLCFKTQSQDKHFVYFTDKNNSPFSISQPLEFLSQKSIDRRQKQGISVSERDFPVNPFYVDSLKKIGIDVWYTSRWFNAALILADSAQMTMISTLGFVKNSEPLSVKKNPSPQDDKWFAETTYPAPLGKSTLTEKYGLAENQTVMLGGDIMHNYGYKGEGITIAVMDNGFYNTDTIAAFQKLRNRNGILGYYNFVNNNDTVYKEGGHGTMVLSTIAAYIENQMIGMAYEADFYLFVTENNKDELPDEEVNWLIAAEIADSLGVDIINTSLGYSVFSNSIYNHTYNDMDGRTTIISKAAEIAANTGMLCVTSAGNEGSNSWQYITAPGDADSTLTAGSVDSEGNYSFFSSIGLTADGRIKPDLATPGQGVAVADGGGSVLYANGTSFSSPILAGLAAGLWQTFPQLSVQELIELLKKSASQYENPDEYLGYGIPNYKIAYDILSGLNDEVDAISKLFPNPVKQGENLYFYSGKGDTILNYEIINTLGQIVDVRFLNKAMNTMPVKIERLPKGVYTLKIVTPSGSKSFRFLVVD